jgi:phage gpG-like protein
MKPPKITKSQISQTINLKEFLDFDFSSRDDLMQSIGQKIIDRIVERTQSGQSIEIGDDGNAKFGTLKGPYKKEYVESLEFKAAGKSKGKVNLTLNGDMLSSIDFRIKGNQIILEIDDEEQILKAFNHNTGDTLPKRPFFGISKSEIKEILEPVKDALPKIKKARASDRDEALLDVLEDLENG